MSQPVIQVRNLGKLYRIRSTERSPYSTFREDMVNGIKRFVRGDFGNSQSEDFWALKDVSFDVHQGEVVGIIGRNGAGKSTLLKILSRIVQPTTGEAIIRGRVGSLLEVGTGFHPELTGRENIFMNGAVLGMKRSQIKKQFDAIAAFAEVEKFLDTPVKFYSSGMYVRLAFAVAAHLEPEILIVDEVLAVGDAAFQKKCLGKMGEVSKQEGKTVLFVSHNMIAIEHLCPRSILIEESVIKHDDHTKKVVQQYIESITTNNNSKQNGEIIWQEIETAPGNERVRLHLVRLWSDKGTSNFVPINKELNIEVQFWVLCSELNNIYVDIYLLDGMGNVIISMPSTKKANSLSESSHKIPFQKGLFSFVCTIPKNFLNDIKYYVSVYIVSLDPLSIEAEAEQILNFTVFDTGEMLVLGGGKWAGFIRTRMAWKTQKLSSLL